MTPEFEDDDDDDNDDRYHYFVDEINDDHFEEEKHHPPEVTTTTTTTTPAKLDTTLRLALVRNNRKPQAFLRPPVSPTATPPPTPPSRSRSPSPPRLPQESIPQKSLDRRLSRSPIPSMAQQKQPSPIVLDEAALLEARCCALARKHALSLRDVILGYSGDDEANDNGHAVAPASFSRWRQLQTNLLDDRGTDEEFDSQRSLQATHLLIEVVNDELADIANSTAGIRSRRGGKEERQQ